LKTSRGMIPTLGNTQVGTRLHDAQIDYAKNFDKLEALVVALQSSRTDPAESLCDLDDDALQSLDDQLSLYWADGYGSLPVVIMKTTRENDGPPYPSVYQKEIFSEEFTFASGRCIKDIGDGSGTLYYYGGDDPVECMDDATDAPVSGPVATPVALPTETPTATPVDAPVLTPVALPTEVPTTHPTLPPYYHCRSDEDCPGDTSCMKSWVCGTPSGPITGTLSPTDAPVAPPTEAPTATPVDAPVVIPTDAPVAPPTEAPTTTPVAAPVSSPTDAPDTPVAPPTEGPTAMPVDDAPVVRPTPAPIAVPDIPTTSPVETPVAPPPTEEIDSSGTTMTTLLAFAVAVVVSTCLVV